MTIQLPDLPYPMHALEPYVSERTLSFHYGKHHATYVKNTNDLIAGTPLENKSLRDIILSAAGDDIYTSLFNNAAQCWNHDFFWHSQTNNPAEKVIPTTLAQKLADDFGSVDAFKTAFKKAALARFGSGWAWLVLDTDDNRLKVVTTGNADTPVTHQNWRALLCLDVWEHAYYLDYQNARGDFLSAVIDNLLNWKFAADNLQN